MAENYFGLGIGAVILVVIVLALYFIPSFVAYGKKNALAIFILNFFLGFTFVGWVGALVWAICTPSKDTEINIYNVGDSRRETKVESVADEIERLSKLKSEGVITEAEFNSLKSKLL